MVTFVAAAASVGAGGAHLATGGAHIHESLPLGLSMIAVGWVQVLVAALVWGRPSRSAAIILAVIHAASVGAWVVSRSVGLPFGHPGGESFGVGGVSTVALQIIAIAALAVFLWGPAHVRQFRGSAALAVLAIAIGVGSAAIADAGTSADHDDAGTFADTGGHSNEGAHADADGHDDGHNESLQVPAYNRGDGHDA